MALTLAAVDYTKLQTSSFRKIGICYKCLITFRRELQKFGVSVHTVEPGAFKTGLMKGVVTAAERHYNTVDSEIREQYGEDYLNACKFL